MSKRIKLKELNCDIGDGDVVIAAITSCTNTSNPSVMISAGLIAKKAVEYGLKVPAYVKTSLAPGSQVVSSYLVDSGLQKYLDQLGFNLIGYGCSTCIGNSGPLHPAIEKAIRDNNLTVNSVLSGNRNFEGRVHPLTKANYLASPPLVVIYALAGSFKIDVTTDAIGVASDGKKIYLKDLWPANSQIQNVIDKSINAKIFEERYSDVFSGEEEWQKISVSKSDTYDWQDDSSYIKRPPFFDEVSNVDNDNADIKKARILAFLGDSVTTDHISPAGLIAGNSPAAKYLQDLNIKPLDFNSYGSRRGNHEVMMRGTFANIRIKNKVFAGEVEGGYAKYFPEEKQMSIYDAAMQYKKDKVDLVVVAGKEYGSGSSRDWAAKGTKLLGIKAVICESFERIHRSNLIGMGVMPICFAEGVNADNLAFDGSEEVDVIGFSNLSAGKKMKAIFYHKSNKTKEVDLICRLDTKQEVKYYQSGGILNYVLEKIA